ncbi:small RNA 2'-O-methyltransferase-like [Pecten maximus]|uniref:small RNA 2'-O-methyltransferase-like n=1 Tax=Pecten maximus TaxID=6579 RepID=UPI001457F1A9|nr:small RNA 2'-O-methyltransferase-like [Pecten maximus]
MGSILNSFWNAIQLTTNQHQDVNVDNEGEKLNDFHLGSSVDGEEFLNFDTECGKKFPDIDSGGNDHTLPAQRYDTMIDSSQTKTILQNVCETDTEHKEENETDAVEAPMCEDENRLDGPMFDPPLYIQRYSFVADKLNSLNVQSVVDFGCAECQLSRFLSDIASVQKIALVDMDKPLLQAYKYNIKPAIYQFLDKRKHPLTIQIFHGDATVLDPRILGYDAVSMVEFIEHLYPDDLQKVCHMVFHELQPRIIIVTTPNYEFNQLFPDNGQKFRHYDHKFEWTRTEFQSWGNLQAGLHGYKVQYTGIGNSPPENNHLGYCSQAAIFEKVEVKERVQQNGNCSQSYTLIAEAVYPYKNEEDALSPKEALSMEAKYDIRELLKGDNYSELEPDKVVILLTELMRYKKLAKMCENNNAVLRDHFIDNDFVLTEDHSGIIVCPTDYFETERFHCDDYDEDDDCDFDGLVSSESGVVIESVSPEESWD